MSNDARPPAGDWLGTPYLTFERHGDVAVVTVDRPEARNALTPAMYYGVRYAVDRVNSEADLSGLIITGTGDVFIPGGDLGGSLIDDWGGPGYMGMDILPFERVRHSRKPVVCAINGIAQGGGLLIAMLSDLAIASERATFRAPELYRGIADTGYASYLTAQIGPARTKDMLYTGRRLSSAEALEWGVITRVVSHDDLMTQAHEAMSEIIRSAPDARAELKRIIDETYGQYDRMTMEHSLAGPEAREGMRAFTERRAPNWVPAQHSTGGRL